MPELPEVETTKLGLEKLIVGCKVLACEVRNPKLRLEVPANLEELLRNATILNLSRRSKYLLINTDRGTVLIHLGMSGSLRVVDHNYAPSKHDHLDFVLNCNKSLRYRDPRRFGLIIWAGTQALNHPLLVKLGPEPLQAEFNAEYLYAVSRHRKTTIKQLLMDSQIVAGVGNIYANEALFQSNIRPGRQATSLSRAQCLALSESVKQILTRAIAAGGSSLRDFTQADGNPGYFQQQHLVYARAGEPCRTCGQVIKAKRIGQRSSFYCPHCQH